MAEQYGFYTEEYDNGSQVETLMTGDGMTRFANVDFGDGVASIGIGYGEGKGLNTSEKIDKTLDDSMKIKWQIKFECQDSVDAMIRCLLDVKNNMAAKS